MTHTTEKRWANSSQQVSNNVQAIKEILLTGEELYQELLELWSFHGNDNQLVANQLFEGTATAEQVAQVADARSAMVAVHDIYIGADLAALRRMT